MNWNWSNETYTHSHKCTQPQQCSSSGSGEKLLQWLRRGRAAATFRAAGLQTVPSNPIVHWEPAVTQAARRQGPGKRRSISIGVGGHERRETKPTRGQDDGGCDGGRNGERFCARCTQASGKIFSHTRSAWLTWLTWSEVRRVELKWCNRRGRQSWTGWRANAARNHTCRAKRAPILHS